MSRPADCWRCGRDPRDWWIQVGPRVWCESCHREALALAATVMKAAAHGEAPAIAATVGYAFDDEGVRNDVEYVLSKPLACPEMDLTVGRRWVFPLPETD